MSADDPQANLAAALGRVPSGLFILTFGHGAQGTGMLVSWVQQCSFEPPQVTVALKSQRLPIELATPGTHFVLNQLSEGHTRLLSHFGKGFAPGEQAFTGIDHAHASTGPAVLDMAHSYLECKVNDLVPIGDHHLLIGEVIHGELRSEFPPYIHLRKSGLRY